MIGRKLTNVFVPTTPNPTSGFLLLLPQEDVFKLDMSVGEGMKMLISGGAVIPSKPTRVKSGEESICSLSSQFPISEKKSSSRTRILESESQENERETQAS